jgi:hypothetical protein
MKRQKVRVTITVPTLTYECYEDEVWVNEEFPVANFMPAGARSLAYPSHQMKILLSPIEENEAKND